MAAPFAYLKVINYASWIAGPAAATILFGGYYIGLKPDALHDPSVSTLMSAAKSLGEPSTRRSRGSFGMRIARGISRHTD
jgi:hypothetical protein